MTGSIEVNELSDILARRLANSASAIVSSMSLEAIELALVSVGPTDLIQVLAQSAFQKAKDAVRPDPRVFPAIDAELKRELAKAAGGLLGIKQATQRSGLPSAAKLDRALMERRLFTVRHGGRQKFPSFQFDLGADGNALTSLLGAAPEADGWDILKYHYTDKDGRVSDKPINLVRR